MNKLILLIVGCLMNFLSYAATIDTISANNPFIEYTGRIDFSNTLAPTFSYSGVSVRACFQGSSISIMLNDEGNQNYYNIILDNNIIAKLQTKPGLNTYNIANGLTDTVHEIEIFKLTELTFGKTQFCGYLVDKGKTLIEISNQRLHLIEFIGNSITCGYGNLGANGGTFGPTTENHYMTYAAITSRSFNARHLAVCKSGIGIYRNYGVDPVAGSPDCMTNYYQRVFLYDPAPLYNFSQKPDLTCIDLGTNDFSTNQGDSAKFVNKYLQFIDTIQSKNNNADILCLLGPMLTGSTLSKVRRYIKFVVDSANKKNNGNVYFFEMSQQMGDLGYGIDYHPTVAQHFKNAKELIKNISTLKGWQVNPFAFSGSTSKANEITVSFNTKISDSIKLDGFSVLVDSINIPVTRAFLDTVDQTKIHFILSNYLTKGKNILLSYKPGLVESIDKIALNKFSSLPISNYLIETKVSDAIIDNTGSTLTIDFNKQIIKPSNLNGITIFDVKNNTLEVDSFDLIGNEYLTIYLRNKVKAHDSIFLTINAQILGIDLVPATPINKYLVLNISRFTSLPENHSNEFIIYPNPSSNKIIYYKIDNDNSTSINFTLYDLEGKLLVRKKLHGSSGNIDFNGYGIKNGSYILKILTSKKEYSKIILF